ncbi:hypothetical protein O5623_06365 [Escherichia coli]|nr:hypothetical protein [Escherichia coli]
MLKRLLSKLTGNRQQIEHHLKNQYQVEENGLSFPLSLVDDSQLWALASWLEQLAEEDYLISHRSVVIELGGTISPAGG